MVSNEPVRSDERVLLTGASGRVGSVLRPALRACFRVRLLDLRQPDEVEAQSEEVVVADIRDLEAVTAAATGCAAVVHLAGIPTDAPFDDLLEANLRGTYNVLEAARRAGCRRFVFASSNHITGYYPIETRVRPEMPVRPDGLYGASKAYGEALCRLFHDETGMAVGVIRIGSAALPVPSRARHAHTWIADSDLQALVLRCLDAADLGYVTVYGGSANRASYWDDTDARRRIGYAPQESADGKVPTEPEDRYQGGSRVGHLLP